jgi:limonene-1,2-epoxide hydrolase
MELVADDIVYTNVGLPTLRGRADVERAMDSLAGERIGFEVYIHSSSTAEHLDGSAGSGTVLNERTDVITIGRFRLQFWVMGRFDVVDGRITLWRDYFDFWDMTKAAARGLAALALPGLAPRPPGPGDSPGR